MNFVRSLSQKVSALKEDDSSTTLWNSGRTINSEYGSNRAVIEIDKDRGRWWKRGKIHLNL